MLRHSARERCSDLPRSQRAPRLLPPRRSSTRMTRALRDAVRQSSSVHHFGQRAKAAMDEARTSVAALVGARSLRDRLHQRRHRERQSRHPRRRRSARADGPPRHLIASAIEHEAVLNTSRPWPDAGWTTDAAARRSERRRRRPRRSRAALTDDTALVSVMHANNEIGTIQPVAQLARARTRARRPLPHRRGAVGRQDSGRRRRRSASICCRSRRTSSTGPRESARSGSAAALRLRR